MQAQDHTVRVKIAEQIEDLVENSRRFGGQYCVRAVYCRGFQRELLHMKSRSFSGYAPDGDKKTSLLISRNEVNSTKNRRVYRRNTANHVCPLNCPAAGEKSDQKDHHRNQKQHVQNSAESLSGH
jgi:hypothetical protein